MEIQDQNAEGATKASEAEKLVPEFSRLTHTQYLLTAFSTAFAAMEPQGADPKPLNANMKELKHMVWNPHRFPHYGTEEMFRKDPPFVDQSSALPMKPGGVVPTLYDAIRTPNHHVFAFDQLLEILVVDTIVLKDRIPLTKIVDIALLNQHFLMSETEKWKIQPYATLKRVERLNIIVNELEDGAVRLRELKGRSNEEILAERWTLDLFKRYLSQVYLWRVSLVMYERQEAAKQVWVKGMEYCFEVWREKPEGEWRPKRKEKSKKGKGQTDKVNMDVTDPSKKG